MAQTSNSYTVGGSGQAGPYSYSFPTIADTDIKVSVNGTVKTVTTHYTLDTGNTRITFVSGQEPSTGDRVIVYRDTSEDPINSTFVSGSTIRSTELNDNFKQLLYIAQESDNQGLNTLGGTMQGTLEIGEDQVIKFEGATANAHETTLTVVDPTADRTITLPDLTGVVVTTGSTGAVATAMIADDAVTSAKIANNAVNHEQIVNDAVRTVGIQDSAVTTAKIAANAVTASKLAADSVNHEQIVADAVRTAEIQNNAVTTAKIANQNITHDKLAEPCVQAENVGNGTLTGIKIADNQIDSRHYIDGSIDNEHIANATINANDKLVDGTVSLAKLQSDSVNSSKIVDLNVTTAKIADDAVTAAKIANNAVNHEQIINDAVRTAGIQDLAVTTAKLANNAVTSAKIADATINHEQLATDSVRTAKIQDNAVTSAKIANATILTANVADGQITQAKLANNDVVNTAQIQDNAVTVAKIADAELTTLAGMQSGTASILASSTALTSTTAELNLLDGKSIVTTIGGGATDVQLPTAQAVNERIVELVTEVGGFVPIANETSFPSTNPDVNDGAGTIVSIKALSSAIVCGSGVTTKTIANGAGSGNTVTINGLAQNTTYPAGRGMLVETTSTLHTYTYHRLTLDESGVADAQSAIDDFQARYRVASSAPTSSLDDGDLYFDTTVNKMKVYNASSSSWDDVAAPGDFYIATFSESFDGSRTTFTVSNAPTSAQQLIISINGVIQKPNAGTGAPSEGFTLSSSTVTFSSAPPSGSDYYVVVLGSSVNIGTPSDNTVSTAKIQNGAVTGEKIATNLDLTDNKKIRWGTGNDIQIFHDGTDNLLRAYNVPFRLQTNNNENAIVVNQNGHVELYWDNSKKLETVSWGVDCTGNTRTSGDFVCVDNGKFRAGNSSDFQIYHDGTTNRIDAVSGNLHIKGSNLSLKSYANETYLDATANGALEFYYDNAKKFETTSVGIRASGNYQANDGFHIYMGTGNDLDIYHDGTNSVIDNKTGDLYIKSISDVFLTPGTTEAGVYVRHNGAVELYYDNSKKLETTANGASVTGILNLSDNLDMPDNAKIILGTGDDLQIFHNGTKSWIEAHNGDFGIAVNNGNEEAINCIANGAIELFHNNNKRFYTTSQGVVIRGDDNDEARLYFHADRGDDNADKVHFAQDTSGNLRYRQYDGSNWSTKWKFNSNGNFEGVDNAQLCVGNAQDLKIYHNGTHSYIKDDGAGDLLIRNGNDDSVRCRTNGAVDLYYDNARKLETDPDGIQITGFLQAHGEKGDSDYTAHDWHVLQTNASSRATLIVEHSNDSSPYGISVRFTDDNPDNHTNYLANFEDSTTQRCVIWSDGDVRNHDNSYGATSDIKLKENIVDATSQWDDVKAVRVRNFNFKSDTPNDKRLGVIAQELETVSPGLIDEDAEFDANGQPTEETTKSVKYSILYMKAFKALQEAMAKIETLETKVAALEAK